MTLLLLTLLTAAASDTIRARHIATISDAGTPDQPIGEVSGLAIDAQGRIYVTDLQDPRILVYAADGKYLATIGRKGQGPGEFTAPTGPVIGADGALYVRDLTHVLRFVAPAPNGVLSRYNRQFDGPIMAPWRSKLPSAIDQAGRFYFPMEVGLSDGLTHYSYWRYKLDGSLVDSVTVPLHPTTRSSWASAQVSPGTGRVLRGLNVVPFHPVPQWTILPAGTILSGAADTPMLIETDPKGVTIRRLDIGGKPLAIPTAERAESLAALNHRLDSVPVPLSQVRGMSEEVQARKLPSTYPTVRALRVIGSELWVFRWASPAQRSVTFIDVMTLAGAPLRTLAIPAACESVPAVAAAGKTIACLTVDPETGSEEIAVSQLP